MKQRNDIIYLESINIAIAKIFEYVENIDEDVFLRNDMMKDACLLRLITMGENGGKVSVELQGNFKEVEWQLMKSARNFFVHAYEFVNWQHVWDTISTVLPILKPKIENICGIGKRKQWKN